MKKTFVFMVMTLCLALAATAFAGDLKNEDSQSYDIKKIEGPASTSTTISGNTTMASFCSDCVVEMVKSGQKMEMGSSDTIVIKNGVMSK
jgi:uncharacterized protein YdeI (BOF family)